MNDLANADASTLLAGYRRGDVSPVDALEACLARVHDHADGEGVFVFLDEQGARAAAHASRERWRKGEPRGLLDGVPVTIKDIVMMRGFPTRRGSRTAEDAPADEADAPAVARLREHGAVILGKTTTPEFGWKAVTDNPYGQVARNPWNRELTAGGSSGGAGVAAALGMGALHLGSDGGGSIRVPSAFCGIVGVKPTFGRVPAWPLSPFGTVSHVGPMTRTVRDAALMLTVMALPDARDWYALPPDGRDYRIGLEDGVAGLRVALSLDVGWIDVDPEIRRAVVEAARVLQELGARVQEVDPGIGNRRELFRRHWFSGAAAIVRGIPQGKHALLDPGLREIVEEGADVDAAQLKEVEKERGDLGSAMQLFFGDYDLLLTPTLPLPPFAAGEEVPDRARYPRWIDWASFSYPFNLTQQPAMTVPCGFTSAGLPIGLQIVGAKYADHLVLRAGRAFEAARPQPMAWTRGSLP